MEYYSFFDPDTEQFDDQKTYDLIGSGQNLGLFQIETVPMINFCKQFKPNSLEDLSTVLGIIRPDTMMYVPDILKNKENPDGITYIHEDMRSILKDTHGVLLYQEQLIEIVKKFGGFTGGQADLFRRCINENSLILMSDGTRKKIKDIKIGEMVLSVTKNNIVVPKVVTNVFNNGTKETIKITTIQGLTLEGTSNHKVLTQDGYKEIGELTTEDYIMTPKKIHSEVDNILSEYKPNSDLMFLFGMLIGDGTLGRGKKGLSFTNSDLEIIEKFKKGINSLSKSKTECSFNINFQEGKTVEKIYSIYPSDKMYKDCLMRKLEEFDMLHKACEKDVPQEFMKYPTSLLLSSFIAGLFNTDGGYNTKSNSLEYYSISEKLVNNIKSLLLKYGIYSYIQKKIIKGYNYYAYTLKIQSNSSLLKFKEEFLPLMVGRKSIEFGNIISSSCNIEIMYDYLLPKKYYEEIYNNSKERNFSDREIGENIGGYTKGGFKLSLNSQITNTKALEVIQTIFAPETYNLLHAEYFPLQIKKIENNGIKNVYDLEVEDTHNYIANDIIVHNCIGKKIQSEVKMWAEKFKEGGLALGYPPEVIETLYNDLSEKGGYLFNKSHSVAYAMLTYFTGYLKANYPLQFMCSILANQKKEDGTVAYEDLSKYLIECRRMGIDVTEPSINLSDNSFTIIDDHIGFGLGLIKGVGITEQQNIFSTRPFTSFKDYLLRCSSDKTSVVSLIKAGAFNCFSTDKRKLLRQFFEWRYKNGKEPQKPLSKMNKTIIQDLLNQGVISHNDVDQKTGKAKYPEVLLEIVNESRTRLFVENQLKEFEDTTEIEWQFEVLNTYLGDTPFTNVMLPDWNGLNISSNRNDNAYIGGTITSINKKVGKSGKNKGRPFAFVSLDTEYGKVELSIFADAYEKHIDLIERGRCIVCLGKKDSDTSMIVSYIETLAHYRERTGL